MFVWLIVAYSSLLFGLVIFTNTISCLQFVLFKLISKHINFAIQCKRNPMHNKLRFEKIFPARLNGNRSWIGRHKQMQMLMMQRGSMQSNQSSNSELSSKFVSAFFIDRHSSVFWYVKSKKQGRNIKVALTKVESDVKLVFYWISACTYARMI